MVDRLVQHFKSRKPVAIIIIILSVLLELIISLIYHHFNKTNPIHFIESLYYSSQIVSSIFVTSGVVIAVWQYYLSSRSARTNLEITQVQRAIDLSAYYKDNILKYAPAIDYVFKQTGVLEILNNLKLEQFNDFDKYELNELFTKDQIEHLKGLQNTDLFIQSVIEADAIYNLDLDCQIFDYQLLNYQSKTSKPDKDNPFILSINQNQIVVTFMSHLISNVLNNMEYFALHFSHKTADESVVYQSLHQSYFRLITYLYYYIAKQNENPSDKYYTNTIDLFKKWRNEKNLQKEIRSINSNCIPRNGTIIDK